MLINLVVLLSLRPTRNSKHTWRSICHPSVPGRLGRVGKALVHAAFSLEGAAVTGEQLPHLNIKRCTTLGHQTSEQKGKR